MADNYLENRMEAYRSGRLAVSNRTSAAMRSHRQSDGLIIKYPPLPVLVIADVADSETCQLVAMLTKLGCKVAFTMSDTNAGTALGRQTGSRFYPPEFSLPAIIDNLSKAWRCTPAAVIDMRGELTADMADCMAINGRKILSLSPSAEAGINAICLLIHPDYRFLIPALSS